MPLPQNTSIQTVVVPSGAPLPIQSSQIAVIESVSDALVAHAGGTQAAALALTSKLNIVATVATAGDSVRLPAALVGLVVTLINAGANSMQVYGAGTDTINGVATATGVAQAPGSTVSYRCNVAGNWVTGSLGTGKQTLVALTVDGAINAHAPGNYIITKAGILTETIAAPTVTTDDGIVIEISSSTNNQHVLTFTGSTLKSGAAGHLTATWPAQLGASLRLMAYQGFWILQSNVGVVIT